MKGYKTMLEIYKINEKARIEGVELHNKFLEERNITDEEFERIIFNIISDSIDNTIRRAKDYLYSRGY